MTTANVVDVSEWQPTTIDFADLKNQGIKAVIIRLGRGTTRDQHAVSHIANAKAAGLIVHGYHYYEGADGEVAWSVKNAQDLGLQSNAYYFLDMEGKISGSWPDIFRGFYRNWLQAGFKVGLYCSLSKYGLFDEKELISNHVYRWIADWDVDKAPGVADIWQFNCSTGLGSYHDKLDKDVDLQGKLIEPVRETTTTTDGNKAYPVKPGAFVGFAYSTTELQGGKFLVSSPDGQNKIPKLGPDGSFIFNTLDFDKIWADMKKRIHLPSVSSQVKWDDIQDKPNLVTEDELTTRLSEYVPTYKSVDWSDITNKPDVATKQELQEIAGKAGPPGKDGESAYQIAVDHGFQGSETDWLKSLQGKDGASGDGDASLATDAIAKLIQQHTTASVNLATGQLEIDIDDVSKNSIADAVAIKVAQNMHWSLNSDGDLVAEIGGAQ